MLAFELGVTDTDSSSDPGDSVVCSSFAAAAAVLGEVTMSTLVCVVRCGSSVPDW